MHKAPVLRDLKEYIAVAESLTKQLRKVDPAGINSNPKKPYTMSWLIRSHLYAELKARGIKLSVNKDILIKDFSSSFPDAQSWTEVYAFAASKTSTAKRQTTYARVVDLVKELKYTHPIELLTCFFCTFGHEGVLRTATEYLQQHCEGLRSYRISNNANVELHPSTLLKAYEEANA